MRVLASGILVAVLAAFGCAAPDDSTSARTARVWSGLEPDFLTGDISPDGRLFSDIDWETGDLRIVELETGESRGMTDRGYGAGRYAWTSAFSTDGRRLAVAWYVYAAGSHELRVMNLDGTGSRVLLPADPETTYADPLDWSPSDDRILVGDPPSHMSLAADWSPDGSHLVYVAHAPQPDAVETLIVRTVRGDVVRTIPFDATIHTSSSTFRWIEDDLIVLFGMDRGRNSILRMDPGDGGISRVSERVTEGAGNLKWFEVGPEAREFYFVLPVRGEDGLREIVARDAETGDQRVITTARTDRATLAVSPDGERLAYIASDAGGSSRRIAAVAGEDRGSIWVLEGGF